MTHSNPKQIWTGVVAGLAAFAALGWIVVQAHAPKETITDPSKNPKRHSSVARR